MLNKKIFKSLYCAGLLLASSLSFASVIQNYASQIWVVTGTADKGSISFSNCQHYSVYGTACAIGPHAEVSINYGASNGLYGYAAKGEITLKLITNSTTLVYPLQYELNKNQTEIILNSKNSTNPPNKITLNKPQNGSLIINP